MWQLVFQSLSNEFGIKLMTIGIGLELCKYTIQVKLPAGSFVAIPAD